MTGFFAALSDLFSTWVLTALSDGIFAALSDLLTGESVPQVFKTSTFVIALGEGSQPQVDDSKCLADFDTASVKATRLQCAYGRKVVLLA